MICALCACELRGFADGEMVERHVTPPATGTARRAGPRNEKMLVCREDDACGRRRLENERRREAGENT